MSSVIVASVMANNRSKGNHYGNDCKITPKCANRCVCLYIGFIILLIFL